MPENPILIVTCGGCGTTDKVVSDGPAAAVSARPEWQVSVSIPITQPAKTALLCPACQQKLKDATSAVGV